MHQNWLLNFQLPSVRKMFVPDPGYIIADIDLDRADAHVVAWDAGAESLKTLFRDGLDVHLGNAAAVFDLPFTYDDLRDPERVKELAKLYAKERQFAKNFVHGTNYGGKPRTMAATCGVSVRAAENAQRKWFSAHPAIADWHRRIDMQLMQTREVSNAFGYKRYFFDRVEHLLPEALAWIPQSTVAITINKAIVNIRKHLSPAVQILLQVHDSAVVQIKKSDFPEILPELRRQMLIEIPYDDPLVIPVGIKVSDVSWGDCKSIEWPDEV